MKKINSKIVCSVLCFLLLLLLIPSFAVRLSNEQRNDNVVVSLYYNDIANRFSGETLENAVNNFYSAGVTVASISEENVNSMVARGDVTNIKYNVLRHKYDDESLELARIISEKAPLVNYDSQLLITKDENVADFLRKSFKSRYSDDEYTELSANNGITVFCIYDFTLPTYELVLSFDEDAIKKVSDYGFDICLVVRMQDCESTDYLENIDRLVKEYGVKYLSIRKSAKTPEEGEGEEHYKAISEIIKNNNLTLVVTENASQLSNEKPFGYETIFGENSSRVLRSYETYDASNKDESNYLFRYQQYLNSTIDRNIRFITVSQIYISNIPYAELHEYTLKATETYIDKIQQLGFSVNGKIAEFDYDVNLVPISALSAALMVLLAYIMLCIVTGIKENKILFASGVILAALAFGVTFILPSSLLALYPTVWALLMPCFGMTVVFAFILKFRSRMSTVLLAVMTPILLALVMSIGGIVMSSLLSGIDYYVNNDIFRGIKLSLFLPILYSVIAYYFMFMKEDKSILSDIKKVAFSDIKVYWIIIAAIVGFVGLTYIRRSGNVNSISSLESAMRSFITEHFSARPRTKEFLVGYPCLVLFVYYIKETKLPLIQAILAAGSAIVAASISNSFCHVFTDASTIYMRVVNGVVIGAAVCVVAYIANLVLVKLVSYVYRHIIKG